MMVRRLQTRRAPISFRVCRIAREYTLRCKLAASTTNIYGEICIAWRKEHKGTRPEFELVAAVDAERRGLAEFRWGQRGSKSDRSGRSTQPPFELVDPGSNVPLDRVPESTWLAAKNLYETNFDRFRDQLHTFRHSLKLRWCEDDSLKCI